MCEALVGPPFAASMFFVVGKLNHKKNQEIQSEVKTNFKYLMMVDWGFYIPLQYFNFQYLPTKFRVLYVSILSLVYDTFLVYILNKL
ncbi:mpv17-like protein [Sarcoptes scabiei]|uniref:Mpv17-like protein n=1 Tax=Sarcoptes scabiei TaxID=52283 RepID=A0A132A4X9_SARSC|nr:mpv17-like protein [Sarcoptes scabiei]